MGQLAVQLVDGDWTFGGFQFFAGNASQNDAQQEVDNALTEIRVNTYKQYFVQQTAQNAKRLRAWRSLDVPP